MAENDTDFHTRVIRQLDGAIEAQWPIRVLALQARRFLSIPGAMWEGAWQEQFEQSIRVEINKTARGHRKIMLDYLSNRIVPTFRAIGSESDDHTATTICGMHRADSYNYKSQQAWDNAFREASAGGFGAYRLVADLAEPLDPDCDDQRVNPGMIITDADQRVFFDPNSQLYDKSDAEWGINLIALHKPAFERKFPKAIAAAMPELWKPFYDWFKPEQVVIAEYYEKKEVKEDLYIFTNIITKEVQKWWDSDLDKDDRAELRAKGFSVKKKSRKRVRVHKWIISGAEVLEDCGMIAGSEIPIVPVYGNREYIDGVERFTGHVQSTMDGNRVYNALVSMLIETASLSPREVPIFDPAQMTPNIADQWADQNIKRRPYVLAKSLLNEDGSIAQAGPVGKLEPASLSPVIAALLQVMGSDIAEISNADDGADEVRANTSAEAMDIAATRVDAKSGVYLDNWKQSVQRGAEIYMGMVSELCFKPGRKVDTLSDDEQEGEETLVEHVTLPNGAFVVRNDLTKGRYKVVASIVESTTTLRDKTVRRMNELAQVAVTAGDQEMAQAALTTAVSNMDGEGLEDFQAWNRKRMLQIGLAKPNEEEQREMQQAQESQQQAPDPQAMALQAQAQALEADAMLKQAQTAKAEADTATAKAKAILTLAQAQAIGGPVSAPDTPDGLHKPDLLGQAQQLADVHKTAADTQKTMAEAAAIHHGIANPQ